MFQNGSQSVHHGCRKFRISFPQNNLKYISIRPQWLEKILYIVSLECYKMDPSQSTIWLEKIFYIVPLECSTMDHSQSTMVKENFVNCSPRMFQNGSQSVHHGCRKFRILFLQNNLKYISVSPPWFEKILYFVPLECYKMDHSQSTMVGENFVHCSPRMLQNGSQSVHHGWRKLFTLVP